MEQIKNANVRLFLDFVTKLGLTNYFVDGSICLCRPFPYEILLVKGLKIDCFQQWSRDGAERDLLHNCQQDLWAYYYYLSKATSVPYFARYWKRLIWSPYLMKTADWKGFYQSWKKLLWWLTHCESNFGHWIAYVNRFTDPKGLKGKKWPAILQHSKKKSFLKPQKMSVKWIKCI